MGGHVDPRPSHGATALFGALARTLMRALVATTGSVVPVGVALVCAALGPIDQRSTFFAVVTLALSSAGWSLLPVLRCSPLLAIPAAGAWVSLGYGLSTIGVASARGWMLLPWLFATMAIVACLARTPPRFYVAWVSQRAKRNTPPSAPPDKTMPKR